MNPTRTFSLLALFIAFAFHAAAATRYVNGNNPTPAAPYTNWVTAATNIQDAIDAAAGGDIVLVTNGLYQAGGKYVASSGGNNRVAVVKPLTVVSVNGPAGTIIQGTVVGRSTARCAYLTNGAVLMGFTLTNGTASADQIQGLGFGGGVYCQSAAATVTNCILIGNAAGNGGGAYQGTLLNCIVRSNTATVGGGAFQAILNNCAVYANAAAAGGGVASGALTNCTVAGNVASSGGGGVTNSALNNCVVYFNQAPVGPNYFGGSLDYCCTTPLPPAGVSNFIGDPKLVTPSQVSALSPCRGAGDSATAKGVDIDGDAWLTPPSVGCDEYGPGGAVGPLTVSVTADYTNVIIGMPVNFMGKVEGRASSNSWDFGDGTGATNQIFPTHLWTTGGVYPVVFTVFNDSYPGGISATQTVQSTSQTIFYVAQNSTNPVPPFADWATAAQDIQSAVELAVLPGQWVLVSNGVYQTGGKLAGNTTNRIAVQRSMRVASVNGPDVTIIQGQRASGGWIGADAIRCAYLAGGAKLEGFTLTGGSTTSFDSGGGAFCLSTAVTLTNCVLSTNYGYLGGGVAFGTVNNCIVRANQSASQGAGGYQTIFNNCTLENNTASTDGGGSSAGVLNDCVLIGNYALGYGGGARSGTLNRCLLLNNRAENGAGSYTATANNCIYSNNYAYTSGGGMYSGTANGCTFVGNSGGDIIYSQTGGGAAYSGTLNSCLVLSNHAVWNGGGTQGSVVNNSVLAGNNAINGGGASGGTLRNCTVTGNSGVFSGGGIQQATVYNSIVYFNQQGSNTNNYAGTMTFNYCCTTPDPGAGAGNITNEPAFMNAGSGDLHLSSNSPCLNAGNNSYSTNVTDVEGNPRISGGTVDMGAYEFSAPASLLSFAWAQQNGLPVDGSADFADADGDGANNWQEWRADTSPTNAASALVMSSVSVGAPGLIVSWASVPTRTYRLERSGGLGVASPFHTVATNLAGVAGIKTYNDSGATNGGPYFYRVGVQ